MKTLLNGDNVQVIQEEKTFKIIKDGKEIVLTKDEATSIKYALRFIK